MPDVRQLLMPALVLGSLQWITPLVCSGEDGADQLLGLQVVAVDCETDAILRRVGHVIAAANAEDLDDFVGGFVASCHPA